MTTKKDKLIDSLQELHITSLQNLIHAIKKMDFSKETDLNATLTRLIYLQVLLPHAYIMNLKYEPSKLLRLFCLQEIGLLKSIKKD